MPGRIFDKRLFVLLSFTFIFAAIAGTLSHEWGHYIVAKKSGYEATIHYAFTHWEDVNATVETTTLKNPGETGRIESFSDERLIEKYNRDSFRITCGGPLQTMLTGTIGLLLLFFSRRSIRTAQRLKPGQWILVFLSLFWLRQTANLVVWTGSFLLTGQLSYFADEIRIARYLGLPFWSLITITGVIGAIILGAVIFKFIPKNQRSTFILAGLAGGISGYILWLELLGPVLMP